MLNERPLNIPTTPLIDRSQCRSTPRALTVKPPPASKPRFRNQTEDDISVQSLSQAGDQSIDIADDPFLIPALKPHKDLGSPKSHVQDLPPEILEGIVGHVIGHLGSISSDPSGPQHSVRNWNAIMRHPRRKKVADLALVSDTWRRLVQERVYRHSEIPWFPSSRFRITNASTSQDTGHKGGARALCRLVPATSSSPSLRAPLRSSSSHMGDETWAVSTTLPAESTTRSTIQSVPRLSRTRNHQ